jgi:hypothetical protein
MSDREAQAVKIIDLTETLLTVWTGATDCTTGGDERCHECMGCGADLVLEMSRRFLRDAA